MNKVFEQVSALEPIRCHSAAQLTRLGSWAVDMLHARDEHIILWITKGQGIATLDGVRRGYGPHNAIFVPAGNIFSITLSSQSYGQVVRIPKSRAVNVPQTVRHLRIRENSAQAEFTGYFDLITRELASDKLSREDALNAYVNLMFIWAERHHAATTSRIKLSASQKLVQKFLCLLEENFKTAMNMTDYAESLDVTPTHLTRVTKAMTGKTASNIITERKLHAAYRDLKESKRQIKDIASELGFGSAAYFTRVILQHSGKTPSALRS